MGTFVIGVFVIIVTRVLPLMNPTSNNPTILRWRSCRHLAIIQTVLF